MSTAARIDELRKKFEENPRRYFAPLANEYRKAGELPQAIALCREHLPKQPGHMSGYIVFGQALYESGELAEARSVFEQALALDPENLIALRHLGDIARASGDASGARRWYERVLDADPRNDDIAAQLATLATGLTPPASPAVAAAFQPFARPMETPPIPMTPIGFGAVPTPDSVMRAIDLDAIANRVVHRTPIDLDAMDVSITTPAAEAPPSDVTEPHAPESSAAAADEASDVSDAVQAAAHAPWSASDAEYSADATATSEGNAEERDPVEAVHAEAAYTPSPHDEADAFDFPAPGELDAEAVTYTNAAETAHTAEPPESFDAAAEFEEGLVAPAWPDTSDLASRALTPRAFTPRAITSVPTTPTEEIASAFGREPADDVMHHAVHAEAGTEAHAEAHDAVHEATEHATVDAPEVVVVESAHEARHEPVHEPMHEPVHEAELADNPVAFAEAPAAQSGSSDAFEDASADGDVVDHWPAPLENAAAPLHESVASDTDEDVEWVDATSPDDASAEVEPWDVEPRATSSLESVADTYAAVDSDWAASAVIEPSQMSPTPVVVDAIVHDAVDHAAPSDEATEVHMQETSASTEFAAVNDGSDAPAAEDLPWLAVANASDAVQDSDDVEPGLEAIAEAFAEDARAAGGDGAVTFVSVDETVVDGETHSFADIAPEAMVTSEAVPDEAVASAEYAEYADHEEVWSAEAELFGDEGQQNEEQGAFAAHANASSEPELTSHAFVTETMGELLVSQGFLARAVDVYEELVRRRPYDPVLSARLAELQAQLPVDAPAVEHDAAFVDEAEPEPVVELADDVFGASAPTGHPTPVSTEISVRAFATPLASASVTPSVPVRATPYSQPAVDDVVPQRSAREWFSAIASRRVPRRTPPHSAPSVTDSLEGLAALFGAETDHQDDAAARALAEAFAPVTAGELASGAALDFEFARTTPAFTSPVVAQQPTPVRSATPVSFAPVVAPRPTMPGGGNAGFSFDKFFPDPAIPRGTPARPSDAISPPPVTEDLAQFSEWLKGLGNA